MRCDPIKIPSALMIIMLWACGAQAAPAPAPSSAPTVEPMTPVCAPEGEPIVDSRAADINDPTQRIRALTFWPNGAWRRVRDGQETRGCLSPAQLAPIEEAARTLKPRVMPVRGKNCRARPHSQRTLKTPRGEIQWSGPCGDPTTDTKTDKLLEIISEHAPKG